MDILDYRGLSDFELIELILARGAKDDRPFTELFHRYHNRVWQTCFRFSGNKADAEDLTQEVFFKVYRGLPSFEGRSAFTTWLHRIALNTCQNELRKRQREPALHDEPMDQLEETLPGSQLQSGSAESHLTWEQIERSLAGVRQADREALYLRDVEERPFSEIAETLGISLSAAKMRVYRTRLEIQKAYIQLSEEEKT